LSKRSKKAHWIIFFHINDNEKDSSTQHIALYTTYKTFNEAFSTLLKFVIENILYNIDIKQVNVKKFGIINYKLINKKKIMSERLLELLLKLFESAIALAEKRVNS